MHLLIATFDNKSVSPWPCPLTPHQFSLVLLLVEDELSLVLLRLVDRHAGEHGLGQLLVLAALDDEADLHEHESAAAGDEVDALLGQVGELVHVDVHLQVARPAEDAARAPDQHRLGVVGHDGRGHAQLLQVRARVDHLARGERGERRVIAESAAVAALGVNAP